MVYTITDNEKITLGETDRVKSIIQNISIILQTIQGSVPLYRQFGLSYNFVDRPIIVARPLLIAAITEAIQEFEPEVTVKNIRFDENIQNGLKPVVEVEISEQ